MTVYPSSCCRQLLQLNTMKKRLKIGFDLDGVLLYNPARLVRPLISKLKQEDIGIHRRQLEFYVPQKRWEELLWELFHKSSIFIAPGFKRIAELKQQGIIDPYLITGRYGHLKNDFEQWRRKMKADQLFTQAVMNEQDEQPHLFKERMLNKFDLDVFVEDNWDIVEYLDQQFAGERQVYWVSNFFDRHIDYPHKCFNLRQVLAELQLD